jgi:aliphatic sulfonates family ABC transporter substrate-binding protein
MRYGVGKVLACVLSLLIGSAFGLDRAEAQGQAKRPIRFAYQQNLFMAPVFVALDKGWIKDGLGAKGYGFEPRIMPIGPAIAEAMAAGEIDVGQLGVAVAVNAVGRGLAIQVVANTGNAGEGIVVLGDSGINTIKDLKAKKIAIPAKGNMQDFIVRKALVDSGIDPAKDVQFLEIAGPDQKTALLRKNIDAAVLWEPLVTDAVLAGGRLLATGQQIFPDHQNDTIAAGTKVIKDHADAVQALVDAIVRGTRFCLEEPKQAQEIAAKHIGLPVATIEKAWPNIVRDPKARPNLASIQQFADALKEWGYLRRSLDASSFVNPAFTK